jgi:hypothetical protein
MQDDLRGAWFILAIEIIVCHDLLTREPASLSIALLTRAKSVQGEVDKLTSGNATLQMYIDNLTMQMAKRR